MLWFTLYLPLALWFSALLAAIVSNNVFLLIINFCSQSIASCQQRAAFQLRQRIQDVHWSAAAGLPLSVGGMSVVSVRDRAMQRPVAAAQAADIRRCYQRYVAVSINRNASAIKDGFRLTRLTLQRQSKNCLNLFLSARSK